MKLALYPYKAGDIHRFTPRRDMAEEYLAVAEYWEKDAPRGRIWTLVDLDAPIGVSSVLGVGGMFDHGDGRWDAWSILSDLPTRAWPQAIRLAEQALDGLFLFNKVTCVEASARNRNPSARALLERLGFVYTETSPEPRLAGALYDIMHRVA